MADPAPAVGPLGRTRPAVPRRGLTEHVYDEILELLMDQVIAPGSRAKIENLARDLDVSPTPVREALARLEVEGLVVRAPMRGYTAAPLLGKEGLRDLFMMRTLLEPAAAGLAAGRLSSTALAELGEHAARMRERAEESAPESLRFESYRAFADHDAAFHRLIAEHCGNPLLGDAIVRLRPHLHLYRLYFRSGIAQETSAEHEEILEAVADGRGEIAEAAMRLHIAHSYDRMRTRF